MAQHPHKMKWKDIFPHGLSASSFGAALGFSGKVSDYVDYVLHVVGTSMEFVGNSATEHGIATESKSRALYEALTGCKVYPGSFFVTCDGLLGCSPDGRIFLNEETEDDVATSTVQMGGTPDSIRRKRRRSKASPVPSSPPVSPSISSSFLLGDETHGAAAGRLPSPPKADEHGANQSPNALKRDSTIPPSLRSFKVPFKRPVLCSPRLNHGREDGVVGENTKACVLQESNNTPLSPLPNGGKNVEQRSSYAKLLFMAQRQRKQRRRQQRVRLLEIKSPVHKLYGGLGDNYQPFGIPLQYMCQMQGQMAIADADECDFFVYVDDSGKVEAWRVKRSSDFWEWAEPKLRQVSTWIRDGPPKWLDRSFSFPPFDFSQIQVMPLVFPYCFMDGNSLVHPTHFPFFSRFSSPYDEINGRWCDSNPDVAAAAAQLSFEQNDTEIERICKMIQSPVIRYLFGKREAMRFNVKEVCDRDPLSGNSESSSSSFFYILFHVRDWSLFIAELQRVMHQLPLGLVSLQSVNVNYSSSTKVRVEIMDFDSGRIELSLYDEDGHHVLGSFPLRCFHRDLLYHLVSPVVVSVPVISSPLLHRERSISVRSCSSSYGIRSHSPNREVIEVY